MSSNGNGKHPLNLITVLDVGSAKTVALICEATDAGLEVSRARHGGEPGIAQGHHR